MFPLSCIIMCMHIVLLWHGEVSLVRLRVVWMTNHPPSVLWHCWLGHQTCKNIVSKMTYDVSSRSLNLTQLINSGFYFRFYFIFSWLALVGWSVGWSVGRSVGWSVGRVGRSVGWLVGWLVGRSVSWSVGSVGWCTMYRVWMVFCCCSLPCVRCTADDHVDWIQDITSTSRALSCFIDHLIGLC